MANILCVETATRNCSVALAVNGEIQAVVEAHADKYIHAEKLHPFIGQVVEKAQLKISDLDGICVSNGPGSYTGLRIGVSAAKGLCFGLGIPLLAVHATRVLAQSVNQQYDVIIAVIDARRNEVYAQVFDASKNPQSPIEAIELDAESFADFEGKNVCVVGDAAAKTADLISLRVSAFQRYPSAVEMAWLAEEKWEEKQFVDLAYHEPFYLKDFIAGTPKKLL
jgi:tRNA threonylcarbamoyladenosine biosynthesis protein TsaB